MCGNAGRLARNGAGSPAGGALPQVPLAPCSPHHQQLDEDDKHLGRGGHASHGIFSLAFKKGEGDPSCPRNKALTTAGSQ